MVRGSRPTSLSAGADPAAEHFELTDEHRMLLNIRDTLYEGSWDDFKSDLAARAASKPHVFETAPASEDVQETIHSHLALIEVMSAWERRHGRRLSGRDEGLRPA